METLQSIYNLKSWIINLLQFNKKKNILTGFYLKNEFSDFLHSSIKLNLSPSMETISIKLLSFFHILIDKVFRVPVFYTPYDKSMNVKNSYFPDILKTLKIMQMLKFSAVSFNGKSVFILLKTPCN